MPPRGRTQTPARRPRVAGLRDPRRHQDAPTQAEPDAPASPDTTSAAGATSVPSFTKTAPAPADDPQDAPADPVGTVTTAPTEPGEVEETGDTEDAAPATTTAATTTATTTATPAARPTRTAKPTPSGRATTTRRRPPPATGSARSEGRGSRKRRAGRTRTRRTAPTWLVPVLGVAVVVLLVLAGLGFWFGRDAWNTGPRANSAVVDPAGTAEVAGATRQAMEQLFSYDPTKMDDSANAARDLGTPDFSRQYTEVFDRSTRPNATAQGLRQTASVLDLGVSSIVGDQAKVLVLVQFDVTRAATGQSATTPGLLEATMARTDGRWKVARVTPLTGQG